MNEYNKKHKIIAVLMKEARHSIKHGHYEDTVLKLQQRLHLKDNPNGRIVHSWRTRLLFLKVRMI